MPERGVINQKPFMKLFSVSVHPSKALHLLPIMTLCVHVHVRAQQAERLHLDNLYMQYINCMWERQPVHRVQPQVSLWANPNYIRKKKKQGTEKIYNPVTNNNTVINPLLCANKHSCHILIIHEILTMVKKLFEGKCKHNRENYEEEEGSREL